MGAPGKVWGRSWQVKRCRVRKLGSSLGRGPPTFCYEGWLPRGDLVFSLYAVAEVWHRNAIAPYVGSQRLCG